MGCALICVYARHIFGQIEAANYMQPLTFWDCQHQITVLIETLVDDLLHNHFLAVFNTITPKESRPSYDLTFIGAIAFKVHRKFHLKGVQERQN